MKLYGFRSHVLCHVTLQTTVLLMLSHTAPARGNYGFIRCGECDESRCPELHYCEGQAIKDHCGCCTVCSSSKFQPHVMIPQQPGGNACDQVKCPKLKVCVVNMQGLPLCTCPNLFVCRGVRTREVCGTDGQTYESRCHMRIASCDEGVAVRKKHGGPCNEKSAMETNTSSIRQRVKKFKNRRRRRRKDEDEDVTEARQERRRRRDRKRKRRKSGKSRARRHRGKKLNNGKTFEETFSHYTWKA